MRFLLFLFFMFGASVILFAQSPETYYLTTTQHFSSKHCQDSFELFLHLPKGLDVVNKDHQYPLIILFDQQNINTYLQNLSNINYLVQWGHQMPEAIVVGIPFATFQKRYYYTSFQKEKGEDLAGIEQLEKMIFEELIPHIKATIASINHITLIGHSRTGYLVNYLTTKRCLEFDAAVAASGFYHDGNGLVKEAFTKELPQQLAKRIRPFKYYMTVGDTRGEVTYKNACDQLATHWKALGAPDQLEWSYRINEHANHMTNFVQTVPYALMDLFSGYRFILDDWFEWKQTALSLEQAITAYEEDLKQSKDGIVYMPSMLHIMSLSSSYYNKKDYATAVKFLQLGERYWTKDINIQLFLADCYKEWNKPNKMQQHLENYLAYKVVGNYRLEDLEEAEAWFLEITNNN